MSRYSINPWMDQSVPVDRARAAEQWEAPRRDVRASRSRGRDHRLRPWGPRHGVQRQQRRRRRRTGADRAASAIAERAPEQRPYRQWFARARVPRGPRRPGDLRGRRRCDVRRLGCARGLGVPDDPERAPRTPGVLRPAGRGSSPLRPVLLPPRHGALRRSTSGLVAYFPPAFSAGSRACSNGSSRTRSEWGRRTRTRWASTR